MAEKKTKQGRLLRLLACVCVLAAFCGTFYVYRLHKIHADFEAMRADGLKAFDEGRAQQAVELLGNYLARYPADTTVLSAYGRECSLVPLPNNENLARAIWALSHLLRLDPGRLDAREQLMAVYDQTGYHAEALDEANTLLTARFKGGSDPTSKLELTDLGVIHPTPGDSPLSDSKLSSLHAMVAASLQKFPDALHAEKIRAESLLQLQQFPEALNACERWIDADPSNIDAALIRVELFQDNHRDQETATTAAEKWIANHSQTADNELLKAHTQLAFGRVDDSTVSLKNATKGNLSTPLAVRTLVGDLDAVRELELARGVLIHLLADNPNDSAVRFDLIRRDWESGHLSDVVDLSSNLPITTLTPTQILGLRTTALLILKNKDETTKSLKLLADRNTDREAAAWTVLVQQFNDRNPDLIRIRDACETALVQNPRDYYIRHFLAETYSQSGERELAIHEWRQITAENRTWSLPVMRLSQTLLAAGRTEQAFQAAADAQSRAPNSIDTAFALADAWTANIQAGHNEGADRCLGLVNSLANILPDDGRPIVLRASLLASLEQKPQAGDVIQAALNSPKVLPEQTWIRLASLSETQHLGIATQSQLAQQCLARSQKEHGITPALAYAKAVALTDPRAGLISFDADSASAPKHIEATQQAAVELSGNGISDNTSGDLSLSWDLARAGYLELIHHPDAVAAWAMLADRNPSLLRVQRLVLSAQSVRGDKVLSERCIDRIGKLTSQQDSSWRSARARWLVDFAPFLDANRQPTAQANEARNLLNDLVTQTPDSVDIRLVSAQAYELSGELPDAISELRFASNLSPEMIFIRLHLARLLEMEGDFDAVQEELDHLTDADLLGTDQRRQAAAIFAQQGQMDRAIKLLEEDARTDKEADTASLLLAQLYERRGELPKAELLARKLLNGHPDSAVLRFAADLFASQGNLADAYAVLNRLGKDIKAEPGIEELIRADFVLRHNATVGSDKIIGLFEAATKAAPANPLTWRALTAVNLLFNRPEKALDAVSGGLHAVPNDSTLKAINRQPDMLRFAAADAEMQPLLLYFVNDPSAGSAATSTLNAIYNHSRAQKVKGLSAQEFENALSDQLRELAAQNPRFAPLQVYLIHRYENGSRFEDAIAIAAAAGRALPDSAPVAQAETELLINAKRYPEALAAAQRWAAHVPSQKVDATLFAADALLKLQRPVEAVNLLVPLVDAPNVSGNPNALSLISKKYVEAQTAAGITPDLAALMQPLLSRGAIGRYKWMRFGVANLPPAEAEAWLQRAAGQMPDVKTADGTAEHVALSEMYSMLAARNHDPRYAQIARQLLQNMAAADHPPVEVLLALGTRSDNDGDFTASAADYRRALELKPGDLLAENNLAMALARTGNPTDALSFINAAVKSVPDGAELYDTRAFVESKAGDIDSAIADMHTAIHLSPQEPRFRLKLVQMLADSNRRKDATDELKLLNSMKNSMSPEQAAKLKDLQNRLSVASADDVH